MADTTPTSSEASPPDSSIPELPQPDLKGIEGDSLASREEENWKQYAEVSKAKHDNTLAIHKTIRWLIPGALILGFAGFAVLAVTYILNIILPDNCRWLTTDEIQNIHSMIFSGVVGGAVGILAKIYLAEWKKG